MALVSGVLWHVAGVPGRYLWRHWGDESVVYDCRSGQTHLLNALASEVLLCLEGRDYRGDELIGELAALCEVAVDADFSEQIDGLLQNFLDLGLVERTGKPH